MPEQNPIKVKLFVVLGNGHLGPIDLTIYEHHMPQAITRFDMNDPLGIPADMRTRKQRFLYSMRKRRTLKLSEAYRDQSITDGDVLVLTDLDDVELLAATAHSLADRAGITVTVPEETRSKAVLRGALQGIPYVGAALEALILGPKRGT